MKITRLTALASVALLSTPALAQHQHDGMDMPGMEMPKPAANPASPAPAPTTPTQHDHSGMDMDKPGVEHPRISYFTERFGVSCPGPEKPNEVFSQCWNLPGFSEGSGTSRLPANESPTPGRHIMSGDWMFMLHGAVSAQYTKATGPRGDDKVYATSMAMLMAERGTSWGKVRFKSMFSFEPAMKPEGYPNLFATGETANGLPIVDRQHPHDLFMELAARVDINAGNGSLFLYGGPVGEPALGPSAFMHRGSAAYNPEPPISHHWFDSTHISYGVVTAGYAARKWQIEASAFRGAEPDEHRWNIETPKLDSWSVRATLNPSPRWAIQASYGEIKQPESTHPGEDEHRFTASAHYSNGSVSAMAAYSAKKRVPGDTLTAWLGEVNWDIDQHNSLFGRIENVNNDELFPDHLNPLHDTAFRVTKLQAGYARRERLGPFELALGGAISTFAKPAALTPWYGSSPLQYTLFAKLILGN